MICLGVEVSELGLEFGATESLFKEAGSNWEIALWTSLESHSLCLQMLQALSTRFGKAQRSA
jgi:hypothetical protein